MGNGSSPKQPKLSARGRKTRKEREARLSEALRENLRKRKAQARGRAAAPEGAGASGAKDDPRRGEA